MTYKPKIRDFVPWEDIKEDHSLSPKEGYYEIHGYYNESLNREGGVVESSPPLFPNPHNPRCSEICKIYETNYTTNTGDSTFKSHWKRCKMTVYVEFKHLLTTQEDEK